MRSQTKAEQRGQLGSLWPPRAASKDRLDKHRSIDLALYFDMKDRSNYCCDVSAPAESWKDYAWLCINARVGNALISAFSEQSKASYRFGRCRSSGWKRKR